MFQSILVPTDGSEPASKAVEQALECGERFDASVHAVFVVDVDERTPLDIAGSQAVESVREYGQTVLDAVANRAPPDVEVVQSVEDGDPREVILEYAKDQGIDVIIMGTHGRQGIDRLLLGSVTEYVMRNAPCSVLVTRPEGE